MKCPYGPWATHTVGQCRSSHAIIALGQHTLSDNVTRGMQKWLFCSTHSRTMLGVVCHQHPWRTYTIRRRRALRAIISLGHHTRSDYIGCGMPSCPLRSTYCHIPSGVACHHRPWTIYTPRLRRAWRAIKAIVQHIRSKNVGGSMQSSPLDNIHCRTMIGVACHQ